MSSPPKDETQKRVERVLEEGLARIDSPEKAREVAQRLEEKAAGATEQSKAKEVEQAAPTAAAAVESAARKREPTEKIAEVLVETAAQAVARTPEAPSVVEAAREAAGTKRPTPARPDVQRGHELLEQAVVEQMAPLDSLDARLFVAVNHLPHPRWLDRTADLVTLTTGGGWIWMVALLLARAFGLPESGAALRTLVPSLIATNLIVEGPIKAYFRRRRPFIDIVRAIVVGKKPGNWSFPSGHTAASFATARMLSCVWPRAWPGFYGLASLVGFSRTYAGAHYPGDVLSGAVVGSVLAEVIRRLAAPPLARLLGRRGRWLRRCD
ncbi:MAG TPA: phosphatase PAP2 family protein [Chloroflexota bacterium]|jgi:undecaprenyl-diphosphatase